MKTHEIATLLSSIAQTLRRVPNVELHELAEKKTKRGKPNPSDIPIALSALTALSRFDKNQWRAVIDEFKLPISVRTTESKRDIVGKILNVLEKDADARKRLQTSATKPRPDVSPELMNALNFLLK